MPAPRSFVTGGRLTHRSSALVACRGELVATGVRTRGDSKECAFVHTVLGTTNVPARSVPPVRVRLSAGIIWRIENVVTKFNKGKI